jgi:hypothetical protein
MRSMLCLTLTCSLLLATSTARADENAAVPVRATAAPMAGEASLPSSDTAALLRCARDAKHAKLDRNACYTDRDAALKGREEEHAAAVDLDRRLHEALAERDQADASARSRATWAWGLGVTGTVLQASAVAVLLAGGSKTIAASLAGLGTAGAGVGLVVATWN